MEEVVLDRILERWLREWSLVNREKVDECDCAAPCGHFAAFAARALARFAVCAATLR